MSSSEGQTIQPFEKTFKKLYLLICRMSLIAELSFKSAKLYLCNMALVHPKQMVKMRNMITRSYKCG